MELIPWKRVLAVVGSGGGPLRDLSLDSDYGNPCYLAGGLGRQVGGWVEAKIWSVSVCVVGCQGAQCEG